GAFSGGNQQKLVLAREMERRPGLLLVSAELEEIMALADRIVVMHEGRIVGEMPAAEADRRQIGLLMTGSVS
ncbi:MAG: hypothetical protein MI806_05255, partial [Minwuiales bacterium]|nr:hypothetical protein [Minwuiales bacterium]